MTDRHELIESIEEIYRARHWLMTPEKLRDESALLIRALLARMTTADLRNLMSEGGILPDIWQAEIEQYAIEVSKVIRTKYSARPAPAGELWDYLVEFWDAFDGKPHAVKVYIHARGRAHWTHAVEGKLGKESDWMDWKSSILAAASWLADRRRDSVADTLEQMMSEVQA